MFVVMTISSPRLFTELRLRDVRLRNRIAVSPVCQYAATDGVPNAWHLVHLGARAAGGAGLVIAEATAVSPEGRITRGCTGLWNDEQTAAWRPIAALVKENGAVPGIQLGHAGRKASANRPWEGADHLAPDDRRAWAPRGPSARAFGAELARVPRAMTRDEIHAAQQDFVSAAVRAADAGFEWLELHFAHGYLAQSFFSPIANARDDDYGGSYENRARFLVETFDAVRAVWPERHPLTIRLGVSDFVDGSHTVEESIALVRSLKPRGLDLVDVSLAFDTPDVSGVPWGPVFMAPFARRFRAEADLPTAVGWQIDDADRAEATLAAGDADLIFFARRSLDDPHFPYHAAKALDLERPEDILPPRYAHWLRDR